MAKQIAIRIPDDLAQQLDDLVDDGDYPTIADAVRAALRQLIERRRQQALDAAIVDGYRRHPPTPAETAWAEVAGRELIAEEPW